MSTTLRLPDELDDADLVEWHKREDEAFAAGEPLVSFDLDGQRHSLSAESDGVLLMRFVDEGVTCLSGAPVAALGIPGEELGYDPNQVRCVRVALLRTCGECGNDYPVNGFVRRLKCTRCGHRQRCNPSFWKSYVWEEVDKAKTPGALGGTRVIGGEYGAADIRTVGIPPLCRSCYSVLPWEAFAALWDATANGEVEQLFCAQCGEPHRVRRPPEWGASARADLLMLVAETAVLSEAPQPVSKPVIFKCPSCLAGLDIDGVRRIVRCRYCESDIYLPDDLWLHLNPTAKRARWWMLLRP